MFQKERDDFGEYACTPYICVYISITLGERERAREIAKNEKSNLLVFMAQVVDCGLGESGSRESGRRGVTLNINVKYKIEKAILLPI